MVRWYSPLQLLQTGSRVGFSTLLGGGVGRRQIDPRTARAFTTPAVVVNIQRQPGANIIDVVDRVKALLPQLRDSLPASIRIDISHPFHKKGEARLASPPFSTLWVRP